MKATTTPASPPSVPVHFLQVKTGDISSEDSEIIVETPVSLTVNGEVWLTFMCTPIDLEALALGFLFNEGHLTSIDEVASVHVCANGDNIDVWLNHAVEKPTNWRRTSGCTGGQTSVIKEHQRTDPEFVPAPISEANTRLSPDSVPVLSDSITTINVDSQIHLTPHQVSWLIDALFESQTLYRLSGGVHTSALSDGKRILVTCEDIGRHNTLDKIAGRCFLDGIDPNHGILLTTGRISSEMLQKAHQMGVDIVISRTSPSSLSIQMAIEGGITLIGYARRNKFNIYTYPTRILSGAKSESISKLYKGVATRAANETA